MRPGSTDDEWREDCAPRRVLELFATKWTSMILHTLRARHGGEARTGALQRSLPGISKKMLTQTLRDMAEMGLLTRHVQSAVPPAVEYRLTPLGQRFVEPVELLYGWGRANADALDSLGSRATSRRALPAEPSARPSVSPRQEEANMVNTPTNPGDDAEPGTPGTGENLCRRCGGSGSIDSGDCPECGGTGKVIEGIGGA